MYKKAIESNNNITVNKSKEDISDLDVQIKHLTEELQQGNIKVLDGLKKLVMEKNKRETCLAMHKTPITQSKDGRWRTRIGTKQIFKTYICDLEDAIIEHYSKELEHKTFPDVFNEWIDEKEEFEENRKSTLTRYHNHFKRFFPLDDPFCEIELNKVTDSDLERFIKRTIKRCGLTKKTYSGLVILLKGVFRYARREKYTTFSISSFLDDLMLADNLFVKTPPKKDEEQVFTIEEVSLLTNYFEANPLLQHYGLILMFLSGLRIGELCALCREDVDLSNLCLYVHNSEIQYDVYEGDKKHRIIAVEQPKTEEGNRKVYLPECAGPILEKILALSPEGKWLFAYEDGRRIKSKSFLRYLEIACGEVEILYRSSHKIRKTYCTTLIDEKVSEKLIQKQMGHKDISTTKKYYDWDRTKDSVKRKEINNAVHL